MNEHERLTLGSFQKSGVDAKGTTGSGAVNDDGDVRIPGYIIECKDRPKNANVTIPYKFIEKVRKQALSRDKDWAIVYRNKNRENFILMPLDTYIYEIRERRKEDDSNS